MGASGTVMPDQEQSVGCLNSLGSQDMTQTIAESFIQKGEERGEKRGEKRGELRAKREAVIKLLQLRFDSIPPSAIKKIKSIRRVDRLNTLFDQAATAQSISEIEIS